MIINFIPLNFQYRTTQNNSISPKGVRNDSNLGVLAYDTVSFGTMKKKEFEGIDLAVVQKFKAPIEKFDYKTGQEKRQKRLPRKILADGRQKPELKEKNC